MAAFTDQVQARLERLLHDRVSSAEVVPGGYTAAGRWRVTLEAGGMVFVKVGTTDHTREALRLEQCVYDELHAPFMPNLVAWEDDRFQPMLVIEDLSAAYWPPPWDKDLVEAVCATLDVLHATRANLKTFAELHAGLGTGWRSVSDDPEAFQRLGVATPSWLERALPVLIQASMEVRTAGQDVIHLDVRSDNLCNTSRGIVVVDWNWACLGNGDLDTGFWLPSLEAEGGVAPEAILPSRPDIAAYVSGFFAARAGLPPIPDAPHVRRVQLQQLVPALRWVARALGLPPMDSPA